MRGSGSSRERDHVEQRRMYERLLAGQLRCTRAGARRTAVAVEARRLAPVHEELGRTPAPVERPSIAAASGSRVAGRARLLPQALPRVATDRVYRLPRRTALDVPWAPRGALSGQGRIGHGTMEKAAVARLALSSPPRLRPRSPRRDRPRGHRLRGDCGVAAGSAASGPHRVLKLNHERT